MNRQQIREVVQLVMAERKLYHHPDKPHRKHTVQRIARNVDRLNGSDEEQIQAITEALAVAERSELRRREAQLLSDHGTTS